jgi:hypothetical protein
MNQRGSDTKPYSSVADGLGRQPFIKRKASINIYTFTTHDFGQTAVLYILVLNTSIEGEFRAMG